MAKVVSYSPAFLFTLSMVAMMIGSEAAVTTTTDSIAQPVMPNFYAVDVLDDGQVERRFFLDGIALKETAAVYTLNGTK